MVTFDNYRDKTWRAFKVTPTSTECLAIIEKAAPKQFRVNAFGRMFEFPKLRQAQRFVRERLAA